MLNSVHCMTWWEAEEKFSWTSVQRCQSMENSQMQTVRWTGAGQALGPCTGTAESGSEPLRKGLGQPWEYSWRQFSCVTCVETRLHSCQIPFKGYRRISSWRSLLCGVFSCDSRYGWAFSLCLSFHSIMIIFSTVTDLLCLISAHAPLDQGLRNLILLDSQLCWSFFWLIHKLMANQFGCRNT